MPRRRSGALKPANDDQRVGIDIVRKALAWPAKQIVINAGADGSIVAGKLTEKNDANYGYDAQNDEYVDMFKAGIVDPTKVVRTALQDAASIAGLLITTEAMIAERPKKELAGPGGMPGGGWAAWATWTTEPAAPAQASWGPPPGGPFSFERRQTAARLNHRRAHTDGSPDPIAVPLSPRSSGQMEADDRAYLEKLLAARTGLTPEDAKARVDAVLKRAEEAAQQAQQAAETARKTGATFALVGALSLLIGAFIASAAAALGGRLRDENEGALDLSS